MTCGTDYAEDFGDKIYCFGCGGVAEGYEDKKKDKRDFAKKMYYSDLSELDYQKLYSNWRIDKMWANYYGFRIAEYVGSVWLAMPIFDEKGGLLQEVYRAWNAKCKSKYMGRCAPPPGLVWKSWHDTYTSHYVAIVEGILDGVYMAQFLPTIALLGTSFGKEKLDTIKKLCYNSFYAIMLDADGPGIEKAIKLRKELGLLDTKVIILPFGDPTDYAPAYIENLLIKEGIK